MPTLAAYRNLTSIRGFIPLLFVLFVMFCATQPGAGISHAKMAKEGVVHDGSVTLVNLQKDILVMDTCSDENVPNIPYQRMTTRFFADFLFPLHFPAPENALFSRNASRYVALWGNSECRGLLPCPLAPPCRA